MAMQCSSCSTPAPCTVEHSTVRADRRVLVLPWVCPGRHAHSSLPDLARCDGERFAPPRFALTQPSYDECACAPGLSMAPFPCTLSNVPPIESYRRPSAACEDHGSPPASARLQSCACSTPLVAGSRSVDSRLDAVRAGGLCACVAIRGGCMDRAKDKDTKDRAKSNELTCQTATMAALQVDPDEPQRCFQSHPTQCQTTWPSFAYLTPIHHTHLCHTRSHFQLTLSSTTPMTPPTPTPAPRLKTAPPTPAPCCIKPAPPSKQQHSVPSMPSHSTRLRAPCF
jgi:hypothetical protein